MQMRPGRDVGRCEPITEHGTDSRMCVCYAHVCVKELKTKRGRGYPSIITRDAGVCVAVMGTREGDIEREENKESGGQRQGVHVMQGDFTVLDFTILEEHYEREKFSSLQEVEERLFRDGLLMLYEFDTFDRMFHNNMGWTSLTCIHICNW